jgi:DNA-binding NtrC family response regulator
LAERRDDIPALAKHFLALVCQEYGMPLKTITVDALNYLHQLPLTGNVRELRNIIERLVILSEKGIDLDSAKRFAE